MKITKQAFKKEDTKLGPIMPKWTYSTINLSTLNQYLPVSFLLVNAPMEYETVPPSNSSLEGRHQGGPGEVREV